LTHREVEVLRLVASGQTSAEIAAELVLSRRSEVTAFAFTHGLISSA
jgi:DNA-binding CsgD family transcriptional regulator